MNTDYSYCSGVSCKLRKQCKRYLPDPPDIPLCWVFPEYNDQSRQCKNFIPRCKNFIPRCKNFIPRCKR